MLYASWGVSNINIADIILYLKLKLTKAFDVPAVTSRRSYPYLWAEQWQWQCLLNNQPCGDIAEFGGVYSQYPGKGSVCFH